MIVSLERRYRRLCRQLLFDWNEIAFNNIPCGHCSGSTQLSPPTSLPPHRQMSGSHSHREHQNRLLRCMQYPDLTFFQCCAWWRNSWSVGKAKEAITRCLLLKLWHLFSDCSLLVFISIMRTPMKSPNHTRKLVSPVAGSMIPRSLWWFYGNFNGKVSLYN
jgi:hypothetical protein